MKLSIYPQICCWFILTLMACTSTPSDPQSNASATDEAEPTVELVTDTLPFILRYTGPFHKIMIDNQSLTHYQKQEEHEENSVSATPKSSTVITLADKVPLKMAQINQLKTALSKGFMDLQAAYGAPATERHYPYFINVSFKGQNKDVLFRSNPDFDPAPASFKAVETILFEISKQVQ